jgi:polysaccharide export outer membrane protein
MIISSTKLGARLVAATLAAASAFPTSLRADEQPQPYRLGPGDVLQITVIGKPELSGKFRVSPEGALSFPLVGAIKIADLTTDEVVSSLADRLSRRIPIRTAPAVEIAEFAGVFVAGEVEKPGQYAFRPGMVAIELIALAGGLRRPAAPVETRALQMIAIEQDAADHRLALFAGQAQKDRLNAEIADADFAPSDEGRSDGSIDRRDARSLIRNEKALYDVRKKVLGDQQAALRDQRASIGQEIETLRESTRLHNEEIALLEQEIANSQRMVDKGLGLLPALLALKRQLSATRRDALDIGSYLARAQQRQLEVDQRMQDLVDQRTKENALALRELDLTMAQTQRKLEASVAALAETRAQLGRDSIRPNPPVYKVARLVNGAYEDMSVDDFTRLAPRDILRIERRPNEAAAVRQTLLEAPALEEPGVQSLATNGR